MENEVKELLNKGLTPDQLKFYGLEYRFLTQYVTGEISYEEMFRVVEYSHPSVCQTPDDLVPENGKEWV